MSLAYAAASSSDLDDELGLRSFESSNDGYGETDFCSRDGAVALKAKIEAYWRDRGQNVMISLQNVGFHPAIRAARYDVRSDMVNGMPRGGAKKPAASE